MSPLPPPGIRVFVVDDHPAIQEAIAAAVSKRPDMVFAGGALSADRALSALTEVAADVVIVDISLNDAYGLGLISEIRTKMPAARVIVFSMFDESIYAERAVREGASGYVMKTENVQRVIDGIRRVVQGEIVLSGKIFSRIISRLNAQSPTRTPAVADRLTRQQARIIELMGRGFSIDEIADHMGISKKTVATHRRRAMRKLGLGSLSDLLQYAFRNKPQDPTRRPPAAL